MHVAAMQPGCGDWVQTSPAETKSYFPSPLLLRREPGTGVDMTEGNGLFRVSSHQLLRLIAVFDEVMFASVGISLVAASQGVSGLATSLHPFRRNTDKLYTHTHARTHTHTHAHTHTHTHTHLSQPTL